MRGARWAGWNASDAAGAPPPGGVRDWKPAPARALKQQTGAGGGAGCRWAGHQQPVLFPLAVFGSFISYIYSAPPLKLKQSGWAGNYALGASYIALPWLAGQVALHSLPRSRCADPAVGQAWSTLHVGMVIDRMQMQTIPVLLSLSPSATTHGDCLHLMLQMVAATSCEGRRRTSPPVHQRPRERTVMARTKSRASTAILYRAAVAAALLAGAFRRAAVGCHRSDGSVLPGGAGHRHCQRL